MRIALAQMKITGKINDNLEKVLNLIEEAARNGAQLICFPELQLTPFFPQYEGLDASNYAISIDDKKIKSIQEKCKEFKIISIPNIYLKEGDKYFDASLVVNSDGEILGTSKMVHIAQCYQFYEQDYYQPSDTGFKVYETTIGKIGIIICFDRHLPESFRVCALEGADIIIIPTANVKSEPLEMFEWEVIISSMQNSVFTVMCNRVGKEGEMDFAGESIVVEPSGNVAIKADDKEQLIYADININEAAKYRNEKPFMSLRRPVVYSKITSNKTKTFKYEEN
ncbi:MAG: carbon-nitrogen hydrolase family protein [Clostridium sp.]|uniref:carbon-nitrogen hydrolase family protein n=1 Tax=Clostridium sp. TaxID=1506 RepID=UPI0025B80D7C|nr:carbon-nitrogen hydrolase family protein [Clostridium sp.]MCE5219967.1 carbon-nitrogen hydrolase family protein [Clostridium sp.]